jgi:hypothetical protein
MGKMVNSLGRNVCVCVCVGGGGYFWYINLLLFLIDCLHHHLWSLLYKFGNSELKITKSTQSVSTLGHNIANMQYIIPLKV